MVANQATTVATRDPGGTVSTDNPDLEPVTATSPGLLIELQQFRDGTYRDYENKPWCELEFQQGETISKLAVNRRAGNCRKWRC